MTGRENIFVQIKVQTPNIYQGSSNMSENKVNMEKLKLNVEKDNGRV